jgi:hypothetical protein
MVFDLAVVDRAESRVMEIATVTPTKAPELLASFNAAYIVAIKAQAAIQHELVVAKRLAEKARATALLDRVPDILKQKGLSTPKNPMGSEDIRTAVLESDEQYSQALDRVNFITCILELVKGKAKGVEMAYNAVKKVLGEQAFNYSGPRTSSGSEGNTTAGQTRHPGFGTPRY